MASELPFRGLSSLRKPAEQARSAGVVLSFTEALETVRQRAIATGLRVGAGSTRTEQVQLLAAQGRVLAEDVGASHDQPPFDRATRDGFAVQAHALVAKKETGLEIIGEVRAGEQWRGPDLLPGQAIAIMTGAPLPLGSDAVVMLEHVQTAGHRVRPVGDRTLRSGENVVPRGAEAKAGDPVLRSGTPIGTAEVALLAACGRSTVQVYNRPMVAIVATGDELVELSATPEAWQIRNSNSYGLAAMVHAVGGHPGRLAIAHDLRDEIRERIAQGRMWDLLLLSGGVSMGKYDLVEEVLAEFAAEFFFTGVRMQPGRPIVFGRLPPTSPDPGGGVQPECLFFGLPGNPVSTEVTFHCFVEPLLRVLRGEMWTGPKFVQATLAEDVPGKHDLTRVLPAHLVPGFARTEVRVVRWQGSGDLAANAQANCYAVLPEGRDAFTAGEIVTVLLR